MSIYCHKKNFGCMFCKVCVTRQKRKFFSDCLDVFPFGLKYLFFDHGISMLYAWRAWERWLYTNNTGIEVFTHKKQTKSTARFLGACPLLSCIPLMVFTPISHIIIWMPSPTAQFHPTPFFQVTTEPVYSDVLGGEKIDSWIFNFFTWNRCLQ